MPSKEYEKLSERLDGLEKKLREKDRELEIERSERSDIEKRLENQIVETDNWKQKAAQSGKIEKLLVDTITEKVREEMSKGMVPITDGKYTGTFDPEQLKALGQTQININLTQLKPEDIPADDKTLRGKIFSMMPEGKWFSTQDIFGAIKDKYAGEWNIDAPVSSELNTMVDAELLQKRKNTNRTVSYKLPDYIHIKRQE